MPPRRNRGNRGAYSPRGRGGANQRGANTSVAVVKVQPKEGVSDSPNEVVAVAPAPGVEVEEKKEVNPLKEEAVAIQIRISNMPSIYNRDDFKKYLQDRFKIPIMSISSPAVNNPWVELMLNNKEDQAAMLKALEKHVWRMKALSAVEWPPVDKKRKLEEGDESEQKKMKTNEGDPAPAIMLDTLPFLNIPYEEQNRLSVQDAEMMAVRLHGFLCSRNASLLGWAEKSCEMNNGFLFKIEPLKTCTALQGYKNKCKFRIGINSDGATTVGFVLNENNNKILGVEPGDKFIHMPESMKYAAKKFQDFLRKGRSIPYDKQKKTGTWDNLLIRVAPDGGLMLIGIIAPKEVNEAEITKIKTDLKAFYETGDGKDCKVFSLYLQIFQEQHPNYPPDKLTLLLGKPAYEEIISGLKFYVSPFSILNINPISTENIYNSVIELAEPTPDSVVIDVCAGSCGIAFTFANKVEKAYAIERKEENIRDALKTKELNNITNVEIIKGRCEDHLDELFAKLKDKPLIVVLDPPRHGVVTQTIAQIRAQPNVKKVIYVCSNSKTGVKNFLDFSANEGREPGGQVLKGLPFLPVRAIPIDVAPYTANNSITVLLERIDPKTYPPAKKPAPEPPPELPRKRNKQVKRLASKVKKPAETNKPNRGGGRVGQRQPPPLTNQPLRGPRNPVRPLMSNSGWMQPPPPNRVQYADTNDLMECKRRIAELEERERAYKQGLTMGMQFSNFGFQRNDMPGSSSFFGFQQNEIPQNRDNFGFRRTDMPESSANFGFQQNDITDDRSDFGYQQTDVPENRPDFGYQRSNLPERRSALPDTFNKFNQPSDPWGTNSAPAFNDNPLGFGSHATNYFPDDNSFNPPASSGYGAHAATFDENPLPRSRFAGVGNNRMNFSNGRGTDTRGGPMRSGPARGGQSRGDPARSGQSRGGPARSGQSRGGPARGGQSREGPARGGQSRGGPAGGGGQRPQRARGGRYFN